MLAIQLAAGRACPQPRLKNKGARATFQWKINGDGPDALRDGYLAPTINHKRQRKALQEPPRDRGDEAAGRDNEEQSDGDPHTPQTLSSLPSPLFSVVWGGVPPLLFSVSSLGLLSLI